MSKRSVLMLVLGICLMLASAFALAQTEEVATVLTLTPADAVADAVANSGAFPAGTSVVSVTVDGELLLVDLSAEAAPAGLGDAQVDAMTDAIAGAMDLFPDIRSTEISVVGKPIWQYLPAAPEMLAPSASAVSILGFTGDLINVPDPTPSPATSAVEALSDQLAGHRIALHPSHGTYFVNYNSNYDPIIPPWWNIAQRTLCGPNPKTGKAAGDPRYYQPSDYYYYTRGLQWPSFYEDDLSPETMRFLKIYLEASGAAVFCSRELDKTVADFDPLSIGYPAAPFETPMWRMAAMYNLRAKGYPQWIWNAFIRDYDADIRARAYYANYVNADLSISLHSNAVSGAARGTETYSYNNQYPVEQARSPELATKIQNAVVNAINSYFDDTYGKLAYPKFSSKPAEWPTSYGNYPGYTTWANRGPKTGNYGEIRECKCPAALMEIAFHDTWKFFPDNLFLQDQVWRAHAAWGLYEGICQFYGVTPRTRLAASVASVDFPTLVGPGQAITGTISMKNEGMSWTWGMKWDNKDYVPYTVWALNATADDQFGAAGSKLALAQDAIVNPGDNASWTVNLTAPTTTGLYTTAWQMLKDDAKGAAFGGIATAQIQVDADPPVITIASPAAQDYAFGSVKVAFSATDALSEVKTLSADIDGIAVSNGQSVSSLSLGSHTLTVTAVDTFGNTATQSVTFNIVNSVGKVSVGGWIELLNKKGTCGFECDYVEGAAAPTGNMTYQDHDTGMTVKSDAMVAMGILGNHAWFYGTCTIDGEAGHWFRIDVIDNGEPGSTDVFNISLDTGYSQGGTLGGGNVTIH